MPKLIVQEADGVSRTIDLGAEPTLIGRSAECQVQTQDALVSRRHARIVWDGGYWIEDLGSSNGVYIGGERVQRAPIRPGDEVRCGTLLLRLMPDTRPRTQSMQPQQAPLAMTMPPPGTLQPPTVSAPVIAPPPATLAAGAGAGVPPAPSVAGGDDERGRRAAAEAALLVAEQRAATAEGKLLDAEARAAAAEARAAGAGQLEQSARQAEGYRRQVEQLRAEIRRLRGGGPGGPDETADGGGTGPALVAEAIGERDQLRERLGELEARLARAEGGGGDEAGLLRRRVDQLTAELRRVRGGLPAPAAEEGRVADLEARLARAEQERDQARSAARAAPPAAAPGDGGGELDKLRRMVEQLGAENRRLRQGASSGPLPEDPRLADLEARLARAEKERDALRSAPPPPAAAPPAPRMDAGAVDALGQIDDALGDLRGNLRAASDEVGVLGVEAPGDSVQVLKEALSAAGEQTETARARLKDVRKLLGA